MSRPTTLKEALERLEAAHWEMTDALQQITELRAELEQARSERDTYKRVSKIWAERHRHAQETAERWRKEARENMVKVMVSSIRN